MKKQRDKRAILFRIIFLLAVFFYIICDAILQKNTLSASKNNQQAEYGKLVDWLPSSAKLAIEYRAKYLDLQKETEIAKETDEKVDALFAFADYIKVKDKAGSDRIMVSIAETPEYRNSRRAFRALSALLLNKDTKHPVSIKEYHEYISRLEWKEDQYQAWLAGLRQIQRLRSKPRVYLELFAPLLQTKEIYRNFDYFYSSIIAQAKKLKEKETVELANRIRDEIKEKNITISTNLINAKPEYRRQYSEIKKRIQSSATPEEKNINYTALATHVLGYDNAESSELFAYLLNDQECRSARNFYIPLVALINENRVKNRIIIEQYLEYIAGIKNESDKLNAWEAGLLRLEQLKSNANIFVQYLSPLLNEPPRFFDYKRFYVILRDRANEAKNPEIADKASAIIAEMDANKELRNLKELIARGIIQDK